MNFQYHELILWLHNGKKRVIRFEPNKINVITGGSNRGKSAILEIIDYCFFASNAKISESMINENVAWYGIVFSIKDKKYTVSRAAITNRAVSDLYYFSSSGESPDFPIHNSDEKTIKRILESEFGIDSNATIPFGGKHLKVGSKISLRYFLIFTTISQNIITNDSVFFDKQNENRYREALPRVFDLAFGIDDVNNILSRDKRDEIESSIKSIENRNTRLTNKKNEFQDELNNIIQESKSFGLIKVDASKEESIIDLQNVIKKISTDVSDENYEKLNQLKKTQFEITMTLRNLRQLKSDFQKHKKNLLAIEDSLKPIDFLKTKNTELIKTSIYGELIEYIQKDLTALKQDISKNVPIEINIDDLIKEQNLKLKEVQDQLETIPEVLQSFESDINKYIFLGEVKAKLDLYERDPSNYVLDTPNLSDLALQLEELTVKDVSETREMFINLLEELIAGYMKFVGNVLENYKTYLPVFDYKNKALLLRKPLTTYAEYVGSSSNHMYLHLFLFLGLHEIALRNGSSFVPSYLIIDQPSRPYWGDDNLNLDWNLVDDSDQTKIRKVFELLNKYMDAVKTIPYASFQMIIFEHVPQSIWQGLDNIHLVESFTDGNALIPESYLH